MKVKTSITLSEELIKAIDEYSLQYKNRSVFIETAVINFIAELRRAERDARDFEIINQYADELNDEVNDALSYQVSV